MERATHVGPLHVNEIDIDSLPEGFEARAVDILGQDLFYRGALPEYVHHFSFRLLTGMAGCDIFGVDTASRNLWSIYAIIVAYSTRRRSDIMAKLPWVRSHISTSRL